MNAFEPVSDFESSNAFLFALLGLLSGFEHFEPLLPAEDAAGVEHAPEPPDPVTAAALGAIALREQFRDAVAAWAAETPAAKVDGPRPATLTGPLR